MFLFVFSHEEGVAPSRVYCKKKNVVRTGGYVVNKKKKKRKERAILSSRYILRHRGNHLKITVYTVL